MHLPMWSPEPWRKPLKWQQYVIALGQSSDCKGSCLSHRAVPRRPRLCTAKRQRAVDQLSGKVCPRCRVLFPLSTFWLIGWCCKEMRAAVLCCCEHATSVRRITS